MLFFGPFKGVSLVRFIQVCQVDGGDSEFLKGNYDLINPVSFYYFSNNISWTHPIVAYVLAGSKY
jgi:hypothetical protein